MSWAMIFAAVWEILGPLVADFLKKLFDKWINDDNPPPPNQSQPTEELERAFAAMESKLPRFAPVRRAMLRMAKRVSVARADSVFAAAKGLAEVPKLSTDERVLIDDVSQELANDVWIETEQTSAG